MSSFAHHTGVDSAKGVSFSNSKSNAKNVEVMDLSAASQEEQAKYQAALRQLEIKRRARLLVAPTSIEEVKRSLRNLGRPITLFGEGPYDRRERLREALAEEQINAEANKISVLTDPQYPDIRDATIVKTTHQDNVKEVVYTNASEDLIAARKVIAKHSFQHAQHRLTTRQLIVSNPAVLAEEVTRVSHLWTHSESLRLDSTAVAEPRPLVGICYTPHGQLLATGSLGCHVSLFSASSLNPAASLSRDGHRERVLALAWHPTAFLQSGPALLATTAADGRCLLWDCRAAQGENGGVSTLVPTSALAMTQPASDPERPQEATAPALSDCAFHPCGTYLAVACTDYSWRLHDVATGAELQLQDGHQAGCSALAFHPDGSLLMSCDAAGVVLLWDLRSGQRVHAFHGHLDKVTSCSISCHGHIAATSSADNSVRIWDLRQRRCSYMLPAHASVVTQAKYAPSGEQLLTTSFDGTVRVWGCRAGEHRLLATLAGHSGKVMGADWAPDEARIASAGFDRTVKLWAKQ